ncbi:hypothetical protein [Sporomusa silvacetica]|uniref:hypothetical protein n=1 Tax=Sporomusa silvacetica TaxID=55504 RepID=UPI000B99E93E|nr:hypothetical protein [Sporomusa silvacetica]
MSNKCGEVIGGKRICAEGAHYVAKVLQGSPKTAIMACEGGCIKGEILASLTYIPFPHHNLSVF